MVKVLLVCSAGMSTSLMVTKMKDSAKAKGISVIIAFAGAAAHLAGVVASKTNLPVVAVPIADVLLLGPQVRFLESKMKGLAGDKPVAVIDMQAYGTMNGEKVLEQALNLLSN